MVTDTNCYPQGSSRMGQSGRQLTLFNIQALGIARDEVIAALDFPAINTTLEAGALYFINGRLTGFLNQHQTIIDHFTYRRPPPCGRPIWGLQSGSLSATVTGIVTNWRVYKDYEAHQTGRIVVWLKHNNVLSTVRPVKHRIDRMLMHFITG